jgi:beta-glucanase (GH16 family)
MGVIWADECDGQDGQPPDPALWGVRETDAWQPAGELQTYTRDVANAHYDGRGHLVITARRQPGGGFTSARLSARHSNSRALFRYGLFEARIKVPTGTGVWPAFWLLGQDDRYGWPGCGEIDVMEAPSSDGTRGEVHQGTHSPRAEGTDSPHARTGAAVGAGVTPSLGHWGDGFHTYAVDWAPGRVAFFIDGRHTGTVTESDVHTRGGQWPFDNHEQSPILNLAVGGWAGEPDRTWAEQSMLIEWVRVYERVGALDGTGSRPEPGDEGGTGGRR